MLVGQYSPYIIKALDICDYIPVVSSFTNYSSLIPKIIVDITFEPKIKFLCNDHYTAYILEKSYLRCVILLFPGIGNLTIAIYDFANRKYSNKEFMLAEIVKDPKAFKKASLALRTDLNFLLSAIKENHDVLQFFDLSLIKNPHFMFNAIKRNVDAVLYLSKDYYNEKLKTSGIPIDNIGYVPDPPLYRQSIEGLGGYYKDETIKQALMYLDHYELNITDKKLSKDYYNFLVNDSTSKQKSQNTSNPTPSTSTSSNKSKDGIGLFNALPPELHDIIFSELSKADLDSLSRTTKLPPLKNNKLFIKKIKEPLLEEIDKIVKYLNSISSDPENEGCQSSFTEIIENLNKMKTSNLNEGFTKPVNIFSKTIDSNFEDATRTRTLLILKKINLKVLINERFKNIFGNYSQDADGKFLKNVFESVPFYGQYPVL